MPPKITGPGPVPQEAVDFFEAKKIKPAFSYKDVWQEEHNTAFTAAKIMEADILTQVQTSLVSALREGVSFNRWAKEIGPELDRSGWSNYHKETPKLARLATIYDTNMRSARAVGQWQRAQRTKELLPYFVYDLGPSVRHRPEHEELAGIARPVDDQFWDFAYPPNDYGCKCYVTQITRERYKKIPAAQKQLPPMTTKAYRNPSTGKTELVPAMRVRDPKTGRTSTRPVVQPGFNYNPGKTTQRNRVMREAERASARELDRATAVAEELSKGR